jgi:hypothetical protein
MSKGDNAEMSQVTLRRTVSHIGPLQIAIIILAVVTALVHLNLGIMTSGLAGHPPGRSPGSSGGHVPGPPPGGRPPGGFSIIMLLPLPLPVLFFLNFFGYITLAVALYLPLLRRYQRVIRWIFVVYAAITIILWFLINGSHPNPLAYIDKPAEVALIILLLIEDWRTRRPALNPRE